MDSVVASGNRTGTGKLQALLFLLVELPSTRRVSNPAMARAGASTRGADDTTGLAAWLLGSRQDNRQPRFRLRATRVTASKH